MIPAMSVEALVLPELSVVAADVLIGSDFVASCGGLHLEYSDDGSLHCDFKLAVTRKSRPCGGTLRMLIKQIAA